MTSHLREFVYLVDIVDIVDLVYLADLGVLADPTDLVFPISFVNLESLMSNCAAMLEFCKNWSV